MAMASTTGAGTTPTPKVGTSADIPSLGFRSVSVLSYRNVKLTRRSLTLVSFNGANKREARDERGPRRPHGGK